MINHYMEKVYSSETLLVEVQNRNFNDNYNDSLDVAQKEKRYPIYVRFCDVEEKVGDSGELLKSNPFNFSKKYYFGDVYSVVKTSTNQFFNLEEGDVVINIWEVI